MIPFAVGFVAGFTVCAGYSISKIRGLRRMIVADRKAALKQAQWRAAAFGYMYTDQATS